MPKKLKREYLDIYEGIQSEILSVTRFHENSDLSTTYLGRVDITRASKIKGEKQFPMSEHWYTIGKLLYGTECQILLCTAVLGVNKSCLGVRCHMYIGAPQYTMFIFGYSSLHMLRQHKEQGYAT